MGANWLWTLGLKEQPNPVVTSLEESWVLFLFLASDLITREHCKLVRSPDVNNYQNKTNKKTKSCQSWHINNVDPKKMWVEHWHHSPEIKPTSSSPGGQVHWEGVSVIRALTIIVTWHLLAGVPPSTSWQASEEAVYNQTLPLLTQQEQRPFPLPPSGGLHKLRVWIEPWLNSSSSITST